MTHPFRRALRGKPDYAELAFSIRQGDPMVVSRPFMIDRHRFAQIKIRHGSYASWAVWANAAGKPKSNVGDLSILDPDLNPSLLELLRNDTVMVALNFSRPLSEPPPFHNFHSPSASAHDFKIRYAFTDTPFYGAYMTDIIKNFPMLRSSDVRKRLTAPVIRENTDALLVELADLGASKPTIIAFGNDAHDLVERYVLASAYTRLVRVTHYSDYIGKEQYREVVARELRQGE